MFVLSACGNNIENETKQTKNPKTEDVQNENSTSDEKEEKEKKETNEVQEEPLYSINEAIWSLEPLKEETNSKVALLTIDDAPDKYALEMAETVENLDVKASSFVNGHVDETEEERAMLK